MSAPAQRSFAGGEVAPALYARTDQVKYATGLRACRNMIVRRHGGATNRPGTQFIASTKNSALTCRLIPFVKDATSIGDTFVLELGANYIRFYQNGGAVVTSGVAAWVNATAYAVGDLVTQGLFTFYCIAAHNSAAGTNQPGIDASWTSAWNALTGSIYEIPTPYATADLSGITFAQTGDVITLVHPNYAPRELARFSATRWTLTTISFGPSIAAPTNVVAAGGGAGTIRYWAVTAVKEGTFEESLAGLVSGINLVPSAAANVTLTWNSVPGAISYNVYRSTDGQTYGLINSAGGNPVASTDTTWSDSDETATSSVGGVWAAAPGQLRNPLGAISATVRAYDTKYTVNLLVTLTGGGDGSGSKIGDGTITSGRYKVYYSRGGEPRVLAATSDVFTVPGAVSLVAQSSLTFVVPDNGYATLQIDVVPEVLPAVDGQVCTMNVNTAAGPNNSITWLGGSTGFTDAGAVPDPSIGPPASPNLFVASGYPAATTNYAQRRVFGNTTPSPATVWASRIGSRSSFTKSTPLQADDMVSFELSGEQVHVVKHLLDVGKLLVFTTAGVFVCGDADGVLTPTTVNPREIDAQGVGRIRPIKVSDSALFVEGRGGTVRDLQPWSAGGSLGGYAGKDLTVFAAHLVDGFTIADWAYAKIPNSVVFAVRSDGTLLGLTYLREHEIWGWHHHDTDGAFENVCVVPEGAEDAVYVVVRRTVNGVTKRYVERFASRFFTAQTDAFFVDAGLSYDGRNTSATTLVITGGVGGIGAAADATWASDQLLTLTSNPGTLFVPGDVGAVFVLYDAAGVELRFTMSVYLGAGTVQGFVNRTVPGELRGAPQLTWSRAVSSIGGLGHLEGKTLAILGDGFVVASPNNAAYPLVAVAGGVATLPAAYTRIHAGLAFISDLETLDLDSPGPRTIKDKKSLINKVALFVEASRGIWTGRSLTVTAAAPLKGLQERKGRQLENYQDPPAPFTGYLEITIDSSWDNNGGVLVRQVDPLPLTVLAAMPIGNLPGA